MLLKAPPEGDKIESPLSPHELLPALRGRTGVFEAILINTIFIMIPGSKNRSTTMMRAHHQQACVCVDNISQSLLSQGWTGCRKFSHNHCDLLVKWHYTLRKFEQRGRHVHHDFGLAEARDSITRSLPTRVERVPKNVMRTITAATSGQVACNRGG